MVFWGITLGLANHIAVWLKTVDSFDPGFFRGSISWRMQIVGSIILHLYQVKEVNLAGSFCKEYCGSNEIIRDFVKAQRTEETWSKSLMVTRVCMSLLEA